MDKHDDDARGLTIRELLLEVRADLKQLTSDNSKKPDRKEVYVVLGIVATLLSAGIFGG